MKANKVIERLDAIRPNSYSEEQKLEWINNLEEMVQRLVMQSPEIITLSYPEDMDTELLITAPFDNLYNFYLESMIDYYNREYGNYNNSALMFESRFTEYKKAYIRGESTASYKTEEKTVTPTKTKQEVTPSEARYLKKVIVNPIPDKYIEPSGALAITENGSHDVTSYARAEVNVPIPEGYIVPSGTKQIASNGTHDVTSFASAEVNVPIPEGYIVPSGTTQITENGTHDVTNYASASVNITTYKGAYDDSVAYKSGDIVVYQGNVYQCTSDMSESGNNPVDMGIYWNGGTPLNDVSSGGSYKGEYDAGATYDLGDIVVSSYYGNVYRCIKYAQPMISYIQSKEHFEQLNKYCYKGEYKDYNQYNIGDIVIYEGNVYMCGSNMTESGHNPVDEPIYWYHSDAQKCPLNDVGSSSGGTFKGEAMSTSDGSYQAGDIVTYNGDVYMFNSGTMNGQPLEYYDWTRLNTASNGLVTLSGGTYYFRSSAPEYANRDNLADEFEITESINGSYSIQGYSGMFGTMTLIGKGGGSFDASAKFDETTIDSLYGSGSSDYVIINGDAQVSSAFYQAFMSAFA